MRPTVPNTLRGRRALYETQGRPRNHYMRRAIQRAGKMANVALSSMLPSPAVDLERAHWIDISFWQEYLRPPDTTPYPIDGVFQRVAFGMYEDGARLYLRDDISKLGVHACSYQYAKTNAPMLDQAYYHLEMREGLEYSGFMQDWEKYGNSWDRNKIRDAYAAYLYLLDETQQPGWVYFNPAFYNEYVKVYLSEAEIQKMNIHWAQWWLNPSPLKNPGIPREWEDGDPWQYIATMDGGEYGVGSATLDGDVWKETTEQVNAMFSDDPPPPPGDDLAAQVAKNTIDIAALKSKHEQLWDVGERHDTLLTILEDKSHNHDDIIIDPPPGSGLFEVLVDGQHRVYYTHDPEAEWNVSRDGQTAGVFVRGGMVVWADPDDLHPDFVKVEPRGVMKDGEVSLDNRGWVIAGKRRDLRDPGWLPRATVGLRGV